MFIGTFWHIQRSNLLLVLAFANSKNLRFISLTGLQDIDRPNHSLLLSRKLEKAAAKKFYKTTSSTTVLKKLEGKKA